MNWAFRLVTQAIRGGPETNTRSTKTPSSGIEQKSKSDQMNRKLIENSGPSGHFVQGKNPMNWENDQYYQMTRKMRLTHESF
jgi:hypothetical protein